MKFTRKLLCLLLALAMVMTLAPAVAFAEEVTEEAETDRIEATVPAEEPDEKIPETGSVTIQLPFQINPLYEGQITAADLDIPEFPEKDPNQVQPQATTYLSLQDASLQLRKQMKNRAETFTIHVQSESNDPNLVLALMMAVALEHTGVPTEGDYLAWQYGGSGGQASRSYNAETQMYEFTMDLVVPYYTTADQEWVMNNAVTNLLYTLNVKNKTDYEKIYAVYNWICKNVTYDYKNLEDNTHLLKHTAYAALVNKTAVCQGYAVLFYRLMLELGVDNRVIVGDGGGPHAWNIVELDGLYYNLDSTWDAGQSEYVWFLNNTWDFVGHERELAYDTMAFHEAYPMAAESYQPGIAATKDPYIFAGYCGTEENDYANAIWVLGRDGTLTIAGEGSTLDYNANSYIPYFSYWIDDITKVVVEEGITRIGNYTFYQFPNLTEVVLPSSVEEIGLSTFGYCEKLRQVNLPEGLIKIGESAFQYCKSLNNVTFPGTLQEIESCAFYECDSLESAILPEGLSTIGGSVFRGCDSLKEASIPASLNGTGVETFLECKSLETVHLPDTLTIINSYVFRDCESLKNVDIPDTVTTIEKYAFFSCSSLNFTLHDGLETLGDNAFTGCDSLTHVTIPKSVTKMGIYVFSACQSLKSAVVPEGMTIIPEGTFAYCYNFEEVSLPSTLLWIHSEAFVYCNKMVRVELPASLQGIQKNGFWSCAKLAEVVFRGDVPVMDDTVFIRTTLTAYYPANNPTWTADKLKNYGGTITWVPYGADCTEHDYEAVVTAPTCTEQGYTTYTCTNCGYRCVDNHTDPIDHVYEDGHCKWCGKAEAYVKWSSISTSLGGNIAMNFYVELSEDLFSDPDAYIQFTFAGRTVKVALSEGKESQKNGVTVYQFSCPITSKNMTDEITAQIYDGDGKVGEPKSMSVDTYCNWVIANFKDEKTVNLMKGMLNYGASAQLLFKYRTDDLANASLADADKVFGAVDASAYKHSVVGTEDGIIAKSMTLLLDSETTVRVYFELTGDKTIDEYTFTVDGIEVQPAFKDGKYYVERPGISAHRLDDMHVFTCGGITVTYGGLSYVNQVMTYYQSGATFEMASALYAYSKAAEAYIG